MTLSSPFPLCSGPFTGTIRRDEEFNRSTKRSFDKGMHIPGAPTQIAGRHRAKKECI